MSHTNTSEEKLDPYHTHDGQPVSGNQPPPAATEGAQETTSARRSSHHRASQRAAEETPSSSNPAKSRSETAPSQEDEPKDIRKKHTAAASAAAAPAKTGAAAAAADAQAEGSVVRAPFRQPAEFARQYLASLDYAAMQKLGFYLLPRRHAAVKLSEEYAKEAALCFKDPTVHPRQRINFNAFLHYRPFIRQACMQQLPEQITPLISQLDSKSSWTPGLTLTLTPAAATQRYAAVSVPATWKGPQWKVPNGQVDLLSVVSMAKCQNAPQYCTPQQQQYAALAATVIAIVAHQRHWTGRGSLPSDLSSRVSCRPRPPPMAPHGPLPSAADVEEQQQASNSDPASSRHSANSALWLRTHALLTLPNPNRVAAALATLTQDFSGYKAIAAQFPSTWDGTAPDAYAAITALFNLTGTLTMPAPGDGEYLIANMALVLFKQLARIVAYTDTALQRSNPSWQLLATRRDLSQQWRDADAFPTIADAALQPHVCTNSSAFSSALEQDTASLMPKPLAAAAAAPRSGNRETAASSGHPRDTRSQISPELQARLGPSPRDDRGKRSSSKERSRSKRSRSRERSRSRHRSLPRAQVPSHEAPPPITELIASPKQQPAAAAATAATTAENTAVTVKRTHSASASHSAGSKRQKTVEPSNDGHPTGKHLISQVEAIIADYLLGVKTQSPSSLQNAGTSAQTMLLLNATMRREADGCCHYEEPRFASRGWTAYTGIPEEHRPGVRVQAAGMAAAGTILLRDITGTADCPPLLLVAAKTIAAATYATLTWEPDLLKLHVLPHMVALHWGSMRSSLADASHKPELKHIHQHISSWLDALAAAAATALHQTSQQLLLPQQHDPAVNLGWAAIAANLDQAAWPHPEIMLKTRSWWEQQQMHLASTSAADDRTVQLVKCIDSFLSSQSRRAANNRPVLLKET